MAPIRYVCGTDGDKKMVTGMPGTHAPLGQDGPSAWRGTLGGGTERQEAPASGRLAEPRGAASSLWPPASVGLAWGKQNRQRGPDTREEPAVTEEANAFDDAVEPPRGSHAPSSFRAASRLLGALEPSLKALKRKVLSGRRYCGWQAVRRGHGGPFLAAQRGTLQTQSWSLGQLWGRGERGGGPRGGGHGGRLRSSVASPRCCDSDP